MLYISTTGCFAFVLKKKFYVLRQKRPKNSFLTEPTFINSTSGSIQHEFQSQKMTCFNFI